jgi:tetratricopeptide (TPR) repeat protein
LPPVVPEKPVLTKTSNVPTEVAFADWQLNAALGKDTPADKKEALLEAARRAYQKALELDPTCLPACAGLAKVYMAYRQYDKALAAYQRGLERHPREASLWLGMGVCHLRRDDWPAALKCMKTAHDLDPENRDYARTYGRALGRAGHYKEAFEELKRVMGEGPAYFDVARMMQFNGQVELSKQYLQYALKVDANLDGARQMLARLQDPAGASVQPVAGLTFED